MKKYLLPILSIFLSSLSIAQNNNGIIDQLEEIVQTRNIQIPMHDGTHLSTDVYLPIFDDSLVLDLNIPGFGSYPIEIIPKGTQYIYYPNKNGAPNPNPYQLPIMLTRTTYDKSNGTGYLGMVSALLGYAGVIQDTRGVYDSEGVFFPLYSDGWEKAPYLNKQFPLDLFPVNHPSNVNQHADGVYTMNYLLDSLQGDFDINDDGIIDFTDKICNGSVGMLGASALAMPQYQLSAARPINPNGPGLKGTLNLIASNEHYNHTLYNNGVFREKLVNFWIEGQVDNFKDINIPIDSSLYNNIHSALDYGDTAINNVIENMLDLLTIYQADDSLASYYPNSPFRYAIDASYAPINQQGLGDVNGSINRYKNAEVPQYHFAGWYDIFASGQIATWRNLRNELDPNLGNRDMQFLTIGPWSHTTISTQTTGDITYPNNIGDVLGFTIDLENFNINNININVDQVLNTEVLSFMRNTLNYNDYANIGEPVIRLPETNSYQEISPNTLVRIPAEDYEMSHADLVNFLGGHSGLPGVRIKVYQAIEINLIFYTYYDTIQLADLTLDIPTLPASVFDLIGGMQNPISSFPVYNDFSTTPPVRAYIMGPQDDGIAYNNVAGNYWLGKDSFPFYNNIIWNKFFLHENGTLNTWAPDSIETAKQYLHEPDKPVYTIGGHNMLVETPDGDDSNGQMNLANAAYDSLTRTHPGVIQFESDWLSDTVSVVGYPQARIFASSMPQGAQAGDPTDTDFFVRVVDVYPSGEEYYVVEGVVNARARHYAKSIALGNEDVDAPFSNIASDSIYEFHFEMLPIGYTFGKGHKIKILISSSNHPKYQSNPNIPLEDGEFFRRRVGQNKSYEFQGQTYFARIAENSVHFAPQYPSYVTFPFYGNHLVACAETDSLWVDSILPFSAEIHWSQVEGIASYTLYYREVGTTNWINIEVFGTQYTLNNLTQEQDYEYYLVSDCDENSTSDTLIFTSDEYCVSPDSLQTFSITDSSAILSWNPVDFAPGYSIYIALASDTFISTYTQDTFLVLNNLLDDTLYSWMVLTDCDNYMIYSDTLQFTTAEKEDDTTSIQTLFGNDLAIYPNPTKESIFIVNRSRRAHTFDYSIMDIKGSILTPNQKISIESGNQQKINLANFASGVYLLRISHERDTYTKIIIKE